ncbi:hypothetical protein [Chamaesiphon sp. VAR_69_metabat_338]|uniref:hypothetical protein n=1 Tax=Chamaesiphon sp. VAR_69_metabat_338 TaxID=2964704 RepID=UPI00286DD862|nr:hypothetical protein [Chamaesiphon sp. VAR_69_metabat_338]
MVGEQRREQAANGVAVPTAGYANATFGFPDGLRMRSSRRFPPGLAHQAAAHRTGGSLPFVCDKTEGSQSQRRGRGEGKRLAFYI